MQEDHLHSPRQGPIPFSRRGEVDSLPSLVIEVVALVCYWGFPAFMEFGNRCPGDHHRIHLLICWSHNTGTALYLLCRFGKMKGLCPPLQESVCGCCVLLLYSDQSGLCPSVRTQSKCLQCGSSQSGASLQCLNLVSPSESHINPIPYLADQVP